MTRLSFLAATAFVLAGCSSAIQTTSGAQYLKNYETIAPELAANFGPGITAASASDKSDGEADIFRQAAAVEPILTFPARFGLARIENGKLTSIPESEAAAWQEFTDRYSEYGSFTLVDPIIAEFTSALLQPSRKRYERHSDIPTKVRLGSARQHLDAVLIYDVSVSSDSENTGLAFADLTIIGGAILPTRSIEASGVANALLLDVRNGYPYGTASAEVDLSELSPSWGSDAQTTTLHEEAVEKVVNDLIPEVDTMFNDLVGQILSKKDGDA